MNEEREDRFSSEHSTPSHAEAAATEIRGTYAAELLSDITQLHLHEISVRTLLCAPQELATARATKRGKFAARKKMRARADTRTAAPDPRTGARTAARHPSSAGDVERPAALSLSAGVHSDASG